MAAPLIGIMGAGSVGCFIGGKLLAGGAAVRFVGRMGEELATHGLHLTEVGGDPTSLPPRALAYDADPGVLADCDVVLLTVKSTDTAAACAAMAPHLRADAVVVSFQNGVRNPAIIAQALPDHRVVPGMVPFNILRLGQGRFHRGTSGALELEASDGAQQALVDALTRGGLPPLVRDDLGPVQWTKLVINLGNAVNALSGVPLRDQLRDRTYRRVMALVLTEGLATLRAAGIRPVRIGKLVPALAPVVMGLPDWLFLRVAAAMVDVDPTARSSMWEDLQRGRRTEIDFLNGEIVRLAAQHGVPTPANTRICALVADAEAAGQGSPNLAADRLLALLTA